MEMKKVVMVMMIVSAFISSSYGQATITCQDAIFGLAPCLPYLTGPTPQPAVSCCLAVAQLNDKANSTQIRRSLCECFKSTLKSLNVNAEKAKQLPDLCHVQTPAPIDASVDCNSIQQVFGHIKSLHGDNNSSR